jgi:hypothetical protein
MAKTREKWFDELLIRAKSEPNLATLTVNDSKTALWRLFLWVFAYGANFIEYIFEAFVTEVETKGAAAKVGNAQWYQTRVLEFQYGDPLVYQNEIYQYATLDPAKRIVTNCAVKEGFDQLIGGVLDIKVAQTVNGNTTALDAPQIAALTSYVDKVRFAGTKFKLISTSGDVLKISFNIYYDPIVTLAVVKNAAKTTIDSHVKNLPFDGVLNVTKLIDDLQKIGGVKDVVFLSGATKTSVGGSYASFTRVVSAFGGYFNLETASGETLDDTLIFTVA